MKTLLEEGTYLFESTQQEKDACKRLAAAAKSMRRKHSHSPFLLQMLHCLSERCT